MIGKFRPPGYRWFHVLRNRAIRVGAYTGVCLSLVLVAWVLIANRVPFLEPLARQRNLLATTLIILLAAMPVARFLHSARELLISGLIAWGLLTLTYRALMMFFSLLEEYYSAFHVFTLGAVSYLLFATLSWIGMIVWRARAAQGTHTSR